MPPLEIAELTPPPVVEATVAPPLITASPPTRTRRQPERKLLHWLGVKTLRIGWIPLLFTLFFLIVPIEKPKPWWELIVTEEARAEAWRLIRSQEGRTNTSASELGIGPIMQTVVYDESNFEVKSVGRLDNQGYRVTGEYSQRTGWRRKVFGGIDDIQRPIRRKFDATVRQTSRGKWKIEKFSAETIAQDLPLLRL